MCGHSKGTMMHRREENQLAPLTIAAFSSSLSIWINALIMLRVPNAR